MHIRANTNCSLVLFRVKVFTIDVVLAIIFSCYSGFVSYLLTFVPTLAQDRGMKDK